MADLSLARMLDEHRDAILVGTQARIASQGLLMPYAAYGAEIPLPMSRALHEPAGDR